MGYMGFDALKAKVAASGASNPAAVAASIGQKKYGKENFQKHAAQGLKMENAKPKKMTSVQALRDHVKAKGY